MGKPKSKHSVRRGPKTDSPGRSKRRGEKLRVFLDSLPAGAEHDVDYDDEQLEWLKAIDRYTREKSPFPTWCEVLALARAMGYRKSPD